MQQKFFRLAILPIFFALPLMASVNVSVSQPNTTSAVGSPVKVTASATSSHPITGWYVYADNATVYHQSGSSLNGSFALATGSHNLAIRAWDSTGAYGTKYLTIKVQQQQKTTVFSKLEASTGWGECGTRACAGGSGASVFWMAPFQTTPSQDGSSSEFYISGGPYSNALHWKKLAAQNAATNYLWDFWVYGDNNSLTAQALEFDLFTVVPINGVNHKFMFGSQCDYAAKVWDGWNEPTSHWVHTSVPCTKFSPGVWHHVTWYMRRTGTNNASLEYVSITVDGVNHPVNLIEPSTASSWGQLLGVQFQQDEGKSGTPFHEWTDRVTLTIW